MPEEHYREVVSADISTGNERENLHLPIMTVIELIQDMGFSILKPVEFGLCDPSLVVDVPMSDNSRKHGKHIPLGIADMLLFKNIDRGIYICDLKTSHSSKAQPSKKFCNYMNAAQVHFYGYILKRMAAKFGENIQIAGYIIIGVDSHYKVIKAYELYSNPELHLYTQRPNRLPLLKRTARLDEVGSQVNPNNKGNESIDDELLNSIKTLKISTDDKGPRKVLPVVYHDRKCEQSDIASLSNGECAMLSTLGSGDEKVTWVCGKIISVSDCGIAWRILLDYKKSYCCRGDNNPWSELYGFSLFFPTDDGNYNAIIHKTNDTHVWRVI